MKEEYVEFVATQVRQHLDEVVPVAKPEVWLMMALAPNAPLSAGDWRILWVMIRNDSVLTLDAMGEEAMDARLHREYEAQAERNFPGWPPSTEASDPFPEGLPAQPWTSDLLAKILCAKWYDGKRPPKEAQPWGAFINKCFEEVSAPQAQPPAVFQIPLSSDPPRGPSKSGTLAGLPFILRGADIGQRPMTPEGDVIVPLDLERLLTRGGVLEDVKALGIRCRHGNHNHTRMTRVDLRGACLDRTVFRSCEMSGVVMAQGSIADVRISTSHVHKVDLSGARGSYVTLHRTFAVDLVLDKAQMERLAVLSCWGVRWEAVGLQAPFLRVTSSVFQQANFTAAMLDHGIWEDVRAPWVTFAGTDLTASSFTRCDLSSGQFWGARADGSTFESCRLVHCQWSRARFVGPAPHAPEETTHGFLSCDLSHANFDDVTLENFALRGSDLSNTRWSNVQLSNVTFDRCKLVEALFGAALYPGQRVASFRQVVFRGCDMRDCLWRVDSPEYASDCLSGVSLYGCHLDEGQEQRLRARGASIYPAPLPSLDPDDPEQPGQGSNEGDTDDARGH